MRVRVLILARLYGKKATAAYQEYVQVLNVEEASNIDPAYQEDDSVARIFYNVVQKFMTGSQRCYYSSDHIHIHTQRDSLHLSASSSGPLCGTQLTPSKPP